MATATEDMKAVAPFPDDAPFIEELTEEEALAEEEVSLVWCTCCASKKYLLQQIDIFMHIVSYNFYITVLLSDESRPGGRSKTEPRRGG